MEDVCFVGQIPEMSAEPIYHCLNFYLKMTGPGMQAEKEWTENSPLREFEFRTQNAGFG